MADPNYTEPRRRKTTTAGRRRLLSGVIAVLAGAWAGTAAAATAAATAPIPLLPAPDTDPADWLDEVTPVSLSENLRQVVVQDDGFPGVAPGDVVLVVPRTRFVGDDLYALAFPGEPCGVWRCQSVYIAGAWVLQVWQGDWRTALMRTVERDEFSAAVLGQVAGWFHTHSAAALREGR